MEKSVSDLTIIAGKGLSEILNGTGPLTARQSTQAIRAYHGSEFIGRQILLAMFERKAHDAMRQTWEEFCGQHLFLADSKYSYQLLRWARVEKRIFGVSIEPMGSMAQLPKHTAFELAKLPDQEQTEAYAELKGLESYGTHLPKQVDRALRDIVIRRLKMAEKQKASEESHGRPDAIEPVVETRQKPDMTPIIPPIYDRGPEFDDEPLEEEGEVIDPETVRLIAQEEADQEVRHKYANALRAQRGEIVEPEPGNPAHCAAVAFMRQFVVAYKTADRGAFDELFRDAVKFLKEYAP